MQPKKLTPQALAEWRQRIAWENFQAAGRRAGFKGTAVQSWWDHLPEVVRIELTDAPRPRVDYIFDMSVKHLRVPAGKAAHV